MNNLKVTSKRGIPLRAQVLIICLLVVLSMITLISFVSAGFFDDAWRKITGAVLGVEDSSTIMQSGGDYNSLSQWESAYGGIDFGVCAQGDLVCADKIAVAKIQGTWTSPDTTPVTINGWTTDVDHYIKIYTTGSARHEGKWNTTAYRLEATGNDANLLLVKDNYVRLEGLQIYNSGDSNAGGILLGDSGSDAGEFHISDNIIRVAPPLTCASAKNLINLGGAENNSVVKVWNNILYGGCNGIRWNYADSSGDRDIIIYGNTVIDSTGQGIVIKGGSTVVSLYLKNNLVQGSGRNYDISNFDTYDHSNNLAEDATSPDELSDQVLFVNKAVNNYHLAFSDIVAKDQGVDLSSDANLAFATDIDGESRSGLWDIGADEEGGTPCTPDLDSETCGTWVCGNRLNNCFQTVVCGDCGTDTCNSTGSCVTPIPCSDGDNDNYGATGTDLSLCTSSTTEFDCNDGDVNINPGIIEGVSLCGNGIDEDCSGSDLACPQLPQCNDSVDNDGDFLVDFPDDPGCSSATDDSELDSTGGTGDITCDETAVTCSQVDVQNAVNAAIAGVGDKTVCIPNGVCDWGSTTAVSVNCDLDTSVVNIIGEGKDNTLLTRTSNGEFFFQYNVNSWGSGDADCSDVRVSSMALLGGPGIKSSGIQFKHTTQFRVDNINFTGIYRYESPITWKSVTKGLIDHNIFTNPNVGAGGSYYGINAGQITVNIPTSCKDLCNSCSAGNKDMGQESSFVDSGNTVISSLPATINNVGGAGIGKVQRIYLQIDSVGINPTVTVASFTRSGNTFVARAKSEPIQVAKGHNVITVDAGDFTPFAIHNGDYIGVYLSDASLETNTGLVSWSFLGDHTQTSGLDFGAPNIGNDPGIFVEIFDDEGEYIACEAEWEAWYDDDVNARPTFNTWDENFNPSTDAAIYIEDNTFHWYKSTIMGNWGSSTAFVVRHNDFTTDTGLTSMGFKPGTVFGMVHDNTFTKTGIAGGYAMRHRVNGLVYNNIFDNFGSSIQSNGFRGWGNYYFTYEHRMGHAGSGLFSYNNTFVNMENGCNTDADCWGGFNSCTDCGVVGIGDKGTIHFRAPISGESLYGFTEYQYPHPLVTGGNLPPPTPVHPADTDNSGCVSQTELNNYIQRWFSGEVGVTIELVAGAIDEWSVGNC